MASISKRTTASGVVRWMVRWRAGVGRNAPPRAKTFETKKEAQKFAATLTLRGPTDDRAGKLTFGQFRDEWLSRQWELTKSTGSGQRLLSPSSVTAYTRATNHLLPVLGALPLASITEAHCRDALLHCAGRMAPASLKLVRAAARKMFTDLVSRGVLPRNPMPGEANFKVGKPQQPKVQKAPTPQQIMAMADAAPNLFLRTLVLVGASVGARRSELLGLRWADVDLSETPRMHIRRAVVVSHDKDGQEFTQVTDHGKTPAATRDFPLSELEATLLRTMLDEQVAACRSAGASWSPNAYLWPKSISEPHQPHPPKKLTEKLRRIRNRAGVPASVSPLHGLRHGSATSMIGKIPTAVLARRLGHASPAITEALYQHPTEENLEAAADASQQVWGAALSEFLANKRK